MLKGFFHKAKTFKPKKSVPPGSKVHELYKYAKSAQKATLGAGDLRSCVVLPANEDLEEWLAVNTVDFFNQINMLYGSIAEACTAESCPVMCAGCDPGPVCEYQWADGVTFKKPVKVSARQYCSYLMEWVQQQLDDEAVFPSAIGVAFPRDFQERVRNIFKRLFRVYGHIYHSHLDAVVALEIEPHLNTCFRHFMLFVREFKLVDKKELEVVKELIISFGMQDIFQ